MALAGRSSRRGGGGQRVLIVAVVVTLVVLVIDASIKSRSTAPVQRLAAQAWIDQTLPLIRASTEEGQQLDTVRTGGLEMSAAEIATQVDQTARAARSTYQQAERLEPPATVTAAAGLLDACLLVRSQAASAVAKAMVIALSGPATAATAASSSMAVAGAVQSFQVADKAYQLFSQNLPGLGVTAPRSVWATNLALYQNPQLEVYLTALRNASNLTPVHLVEVASVTTDPRPERELTPGGVQVLPLQASIEVQVVVANVGNVGESNLTVTTQIAPAIKQPSVRDFLTPLEPGVAQSLTLGRLYPEPGVPVTLTVTVTGPAAAALPPTTRTLTFEMPSAANPLTSTSSLATPNTVAPTAATVPGSPTTTATVPTVATGTTTTTAGGG